MPDIIAQRDLRNDNAEIMRRVEAGESFVITRNGRPVADLVPHGQAAAPTRRKTLGELQQERRRNGPRVDLGQWLADRDQSDLIFGDDRIEY
ncbi:MAG: type II toxin-antitoxin system prevent-host-death family antitoxin [Pseudonocardiales bacterium]|nr:type II toxin-antitoxin system prevent-host-death family antitoxin [Pseudonocardiales bacterium]